MLRLLLLSLFGLGATASVADAQIRQNPIPEENELAPHGLTLAWWNRAVIDPRSDKIRSFTADEQAVFVQSTTGVVTAFDAETGKILWSKLIGKSNQVAYPIVSNDDMIFLAAGMRLHGVHKASGESMWEISLPHHPSAAPEVDEDQVYVGTVDGSVYAFSLAEISRLYRERLLPQYSHQTEVCRYQAPTEIVSPPVSNGQAVVFASFSGLLFSVTAKDRGTNFQFETEGRAPIRVPVGRNEDTVFVASDDLRVFALDMISGNRRWSFTAGAPIRTQPRVIGNDIYIAPTRRGLFSLRANTGFQNWHQRQAEEFLAATPDTVYASNEIGDVLLLDRKTGAITARLPLRHFSERVRNERTDRLYLATSGGLIVCIREAARTHPLWHLFPERQPLNPELAPDSSTPADNDPDAPDSLDGEINPLDQ